MSAALVLQGGAFFFSSCPWANTAHALTVPYAVRSPAAESVAIVALRNVVSSDGRGVDPALAAVVAYDVRSFAIGTSLRETAAAIREMRPADALRAIVAYDRRRADVIGLPLRKEAIELFVF